MYGDDYICQFLNTERDQTWAHNRLIYLELGTEKTRRTETETGW